MFDFLTTLICESILTHLNDVQRKIFIILFVSPHHPSLHINTTDFDRGGAFYKTSNATPSFICNYTLGRILPVYYEYTYILSSKININKKNDLFKVNNKFKIIINDFVED
ncbi:unnamed protein product [Chrysodeixis includens]|uniref:Uncharacterized protein n=1 Tax=Chrysodeixis includens TaxID=689277 RepID=A0A9N8PZI5_CHRIL|nr:unnamed protein product [Chrysodeixis includens]